MILKVIGFSIVAIAGFIAGLALKDDLMTPENASAQVCEQKTPAQLFVGLIDNDFSDLAIKKELPGAWTHIKTVEYKMGSTLGNALLGDQRPHFPQTGQGKGHLEVEVLDLPDESNPGVILQVSLFDIETNNKIFEIGRTYTMKDLNKLPEPPVHEEKANE